MGIIRSGNTWQFESEFDLEELLWHNLADLLQLKVSKRQFFVQGQYCDILATDEQNRLVVLELKNVEDRYIVQQLTRYYQALKQENPFGSVIDPEAPIRLVAIAPSFHQDTLTDRQFSILDIELIHFELVESDQGLQLKLIDEKSQTLGSLPIPTSAIAQPEVSVPAPPRKLLNWLSQSPKEEFEAIIQVRERILSYDPRMKEVVEPQRILYGKGKTVPCAEIRQDKRLKEKFPCLFLWLPDLEGNSRILRKRVYTTPDCQSVKGLIYCPYGTKAKSFWNFPQCFQVPYYKNAAVLEQYQQAMNVEGKPYILSGLVEFALKTWHQRI